MLPGRGEENFHSEYKDLKRHLIATVLHSGSTQDRQERHHGY